MLRSVDLVLGIGDGVERVMHDHNTVGLGSQILRALGVGKIRLMGPAIRYNAISGFGLEVVEHLSA